MQPTSPDFGARPKATDTLLYCSVYYACYRASRSDVILHGVESRRNEFMTGLFTPYIHANARRDLKSAKFQTGNIWTISDGIPYVEFAQENGKLKGWIPSQAPFMNNMELVSTILKYCIEPEYPHWQPSIMQTLAIR